MKHHPRRTVNRQDWATPQELFDVLDAEFSFTLDPCASATTAKCARYFTRADDGLAQPWTREVVFCNPPYAQKKAWVRKAFREAACHGATVVLLIPAAMGTSIFWTHCRQGEIRFLRGRLKFDDGAGSAPFGSCLVIFRPGIPPDNARLLFWDAWRPVAARDRLSRRADARR